MGLSIGTQSGVGQQGKRARAGLGLSKPTRHGRSHSHTLPVRTAMALPPVAAAIASMPSGTGLPSGQM